MSSTRYPHQSVLFCLTLQNLWLPLAASGSFLLPYLREVARQGQNLDLRQWCSSSIAIGLNNVYLWEGGLYVEYVEATTSPMTPDSIEWAGQVKHASLEEVPKYMMPTDPTNVGPVEQNVASPRPTSQT